MFSECTRRAQTAINLVGGYLNEFFDFMPASFFQKTTRSLHVRSNERSRVENRPVNVRFGREIHHGIESVLFEKFCNLRAICDVSTDEFIARVFRDLVQIVEITGIGKQIVVDEFGIRARTQEVANEAGADE